MKHRIIKLVGIMAMVLVVGMGASECEGETSEAQESGQKQTEQAFKQQSGAVPYPADKLKDSLERRNLREKLLRDNKPNSIRYVYLLSFAKPLGFYTIKGKVSSTQSQMTTSELIVDDKNDPGQSVIIAPGDDGSYGDNEKGIFFFTTEGVMVTTNLDYIVSDQPLPFDVPELAN